MTAPDAETPIDRAFNATDLPHGEFGAFKAGWEAMAATVVDAFEVAYQTPGSAAVPSEPRRPNPELVERIRRVLAKGSYQMPEDALPYEAKALEVASVVEEVGPVSEAEARADAMRAAILSAMHSSAYVGGPTERETWRTALEALSPFETQHTGQDAVLSAAREVKSDG